MSRPYDPFGLRSDPAFDFVDEAACRDIEDREIFFPTPADVETRDKAFAICHSCVVENECFEWALKRPQEIGVWGGTSKEDRDEMRKVAV